MARYRRDSGVSEVVAQIWDAHSRTDPVCAERQGMTHVRVLNPYRRARPPKWVTDGLDAARE